MDTFLPSQTLKAASVLAGRVSLDQVRIKQASFASTGEWEGVGQVPTNELEHTISPGAYSFDEESNTLDVEIAFKAVLKGPKRNSPGLQIEAAFVARYSLTTTPPPVEVREIFFDSFAKSNALLNVWPYWREFASSCNDRMAIPHWNLPVLRFLPDPKEVKALPTKSVSARRKALALSGAATPAVPEPKARRKNQRG